MNKRQSQIMDDFSNSVHTAPAVSQDATSKIMPEAPEGVMTIRNAPPVQQPSQAAPYSSAIESFIKGTPDAENPKQVLTVTFTVSPKGEELKGIKLMEAVLKACGEVGADIKDFTIRKDTTKK